MTHFHVYAKGRRECHEDPGPAPPAIRVLQPNWNTSVWRRDAPPPSEVLTGTIIDCDRVEWVCSCDGAKHPTWLEYWDRERAAAIQSDRAFDVLTRTTFLLHDAAARMGAHPRNQALNRRPWTPDFWTAKGVRSQ